MVMKKMEKASKDYDFEDDDNDGDGWLARVYLTLVYPVCFGYGLRS
jgi:hypothetical protein